MFGVVGVVSLHRLLLLLLQNKLEAFITDAMFISVHWNGLFFSGLIVTFFEQTSASICQKETNSEAYQPNDVVFEVFLRFNEAVFDDTSLQHFCRSFNYLSFLLY